MSNIQAHPFIGRYVIIRTYSEGVHIGVLRRFEGREVELTDCRRIWSWQGANTLHEIALRGVHTGSRVSEAIEAILLTQAGEIIPVTPEAEANLRAAGWAA